MAADATTTKNPSGAEGRLWLALQLGPAYLRGCLARVTGAAADAAPESGAIHIERWLERAWETPATHRLSENLDEIKAAIEELRAGAAERPTGCFCIHPLWALVRKVPAPRASRREIEQVLALQVEREKSFIRGDDLVWDYVLPPAGHATETGLEGAPPRQALLVMSRTETIGPIEQAFRESQVPLAAGGVTSFCQGHYLRSRESFPRSSEQTIVQLEARQASLLEFREGRVTDSFCQRFEAGADGTGAHRMFAYNFAERYQDGRRAGQVVICGAAEQRATFRASLNGLENVVEYSPDAPARFVSYAPEARQAADEEQDAPLLGLLLAHASGRKVGINLAAAPERARAQGGRLALLKQPRTAIPLAAALAVAALGLLLVGGWLKNRMYEGALREAAAVTLDFDAARFNKDLLERFARERQPYLDYLLELSEVMPQGVTLASLKIDKQGAVIFAGKCSAYSMAQNFAGKLNAGKYFRGAAIDRMGAQKGGSVQFTIRCQLKRGTGGAS